MSTSKSPFTLSGWQIAVLALLRVAIGWHFLYEGLSKLFTPGWTAEGFLTSSRWVLSDAFQWIVAHPPVLRAVDLLNMWGLCAIGLCLILGLFSRLTSFAGMALIAFYYAAHPPLPNLDFGMSREGSYLIVDKNLVELFADRDQP